MVGASNLTHEASEQHEQRDEHDGEDEEVGVGDEPVGPVAEPVHAHHGARVLLLLVHDVLDEHLRARAHGWDEMIRSRHCTQAAQQYDLIEQLLRFSGVNISPYQNIRNLESLQDSVQMTGAHKVSWETRVSGLRHRAWVYAGSCTNWEDQRMQKRFPARIVGDKGSGFMAGRVCVCAVSQLHSPGRAAAAPTCRTGGPAPRRSQGTGRYLVWGSR